ncbi:hypothetical protein OIU84_018496 [Salix udensis]|uniref:Uncharacterized protein n=1 Tax=Salix udensis TaxID=889485 RepID=A0AAD6KWV4_9ROSI|nr:hypothetical protein OIU84_018496 [Salix udensis]
MHNNPIRITLPTILCRPGGGSKPQRHITHRKHDNPIILIDTISNLPQATLSTHDSHTKKTSLKWASAKLYF